MNCQHCVATEVGFAAHLRQKVSQHRANAQKLGICNQVLSLGIGQPTDALLVRLGHGWVEQPELDGMDVVGALGRRAWRFELADGNFDIDGADLVRAGILGKRWNWAQASQVLAHLARRGGLFCSHCESLGVDAPNSKIQSKRLKSPQKEREQTRGIKNDNSCDFKTNKTEEKATITRVEFRTEYYCASTRKNRGAWTLSVTHCTVHMSKPQDLNGLPAKLP